MKSLVVANWKMNPATSRDAKKLFDATKRAAESAKSVAVIVAPPSLYLRELASGYKGKRIGFAAQNAHFETTGSFTGEISIAQVKDARASHLIIAHAERRQMGETNQEANKKVLAALALGITPILCIGEKTRSQTGDHFVFVRDQIIDGLRGVQPQKLGKVIIAYEPVWAIGAEKPMSASDMHEMAIFIRKTIVDAMGPTGMTVKVLYGGSIDENNAADMLQNGDVHGLLVGRASTDAKKFAALLSACHDA